VSGQPLRDLIAGVKKESVVPSKDREMRREQVARWRLKNPEYDARYYVKNREREKARKQATRQCVEGREGLNAAHARSRAVHPERERKYNARYYTKNRERMCEKAARWYAANLERAREYSTENREKLREASARWYVENRERAAERGAHWRAENPEKSHEKGVKRRALRAGAVIGDPAMLREFFRWARTTLVIPCWWCGSVTVSGRKRHIDHAIPLSRGGKHSIGNLYVVCESCNLIKGGRPLAEWLGRLLGEARRLEISTPPMSHAGKREVPLNS
jgi:5-methylcytosine-specific restriction endonuclease McrA